MRASPLRVSHAITVIECSQMGIGFQTPNLHPTPTLTLYNRTGYSLRISEYRIDEKKWIKEQSVDDMDTPGTFLNPRALKIRVVNVEDLEFSLRPLSGNET